jgi:hypothetical protein
MTCTNCGIDLDLDMDDVLCGDCADTWEPMFPDNGDIIIADAGNRGYAVSEYGEGFVMYCADWDEAETAVRAHMDHQRFWPNVWARSDHGNLDLITL